MKEEEDSYISDSTSKYQKLEDECSQLRKANHTLTQRVTEAKQMLKEMALQHEAELKSQSKDLIEWKERAESLEHHNKELRLKAAESVVNRDYHTAQDEDPGNAGPLAAQVYMEWAHPRIPITLRNDGDDYISYQYGQNDHEMKKGSLDPTQVVQVMLLAHTQYKFYVRVGSRTISKFKVFTKDTDFDLAQLFV